ncbi:MAG: hypothetical protein A3K19_10995 [Lentisphaerae bacterium RIFOXYB12_FULL_65_16]|nr:MAG: hypothetical protein A3K18_17275 [Lentisphaerae bacterium RIFOXYA12_64_32]OGV87110.1 MAG: hypothetical protein A3K19_10995 [Lentisphaerae bacterium RIFOXYB12_FULL_65_16]
MNKPRKPLLGLCPIGKFVFSNEDAIRQKKRLQKLLRQWKMPFVDLEGVLEDGLVKDQSHVDTVVAHFRAAGVECLFLPHCNFGTEGAVGMIAHKLGLPTLLWGPRDEAPLPDGSRLRDSLCGLFASSKVLHKLGVPFTYIENCRIDDPALATGVDRFLRAAHVANAFRSGVRIGHIGQRIDFFWTTIINESELLERFKVEVLPLDMVEFIRATKDRARRGQAGYRKEVARLRQRMTVEGFDDPAALIVSLAARDQMLAMADEHGLEGLAVQDFMSLVNEVGAYCFFAECFVCDKLAVGYESDIHGAISNVLVQRASLGTEPAYLADVTIRHPTNDNGILLWHGGAPLSMCDPGVKPRVGQHWILPSPLSGMPHFRMKQGPITTARFDGDRGDYMLAVGEGRGIDGPDTLNNYVWMEVNNWPAWERTLIQGPFIHHVAMAYGHFGDALAEACRYIPGLTPVRLGEGTTPVSG